MHGLKIASLVIILHVVILASMIYLQPLAPKTPPHKPVSINTYVVQEQEIPKPIVQETPKPVVKETPKPEVKEIPKPIVKETPKPEVKETPKPIVKETPKPKAKEAPKKPVVKETPKPEVKETPKPIVKEAPKPKAKEAPKPVVKTTPQPKPIIKEAPKKDPNREKLAQLMQQSLTSLESTPTKTAPQQSKSPKQIQTLASEAITFETAYQNQLIAFLEAALTLPEKGDVKIALTLNRNGGVKNITVKAASSERNRTYVESTVPTLLLPSFEHHFKNESNHTFSITLTSS